MQFRQKTQSEAVIPTVSMADIAFLLIIFFMQTTIFATEAGLTILLPEAGEVKVKSKNMLAVLVNKDGVVRIGDEVVGLEAVQSVLEKKLAENDSLIVTLKVARQCAYGRMIEVFDKVKLAGAERISFAPAPRK